MSADLVWLLVRSNSSFLVKRNGLQLSTERGNLTNKHSLKFSGISADNTIDVTAGAKGVVVKVAKKTVRRSFPLVKSEALTKRSVSRIVAAVRPDLALAAVERAKKILRSQRPVVASTKAKKTRSRK